MFLRTLHKVSDTDFISAEVKSLYFGVELFSCSCLHDATPLNTTINQILETSTHA